MKRTCPVSLICLIGVIAFALVSCAGGASARPDSMLGPASTDAVQITRLAAKQVESFGAIGANPYIARSSLLFKNDQVVFYVYELALPPSSTIRVRLISGVLTDGSGAEAGTLLTVDDLRGYWSKYLMPVADKQDVESIVDRTYMGRFEFDYSSSRSRSYVLVFKGDAPARPNVSATFVLTVSGQERLIEVR